MSHNSGSEVAKAEAALLVAALQKPKTETSPVLNGIVWGSILFAGVLLARNTTVHNMERTQNFYASCPQDMVLVDDTAKLHPQPVDLVDLTCSDGRVNVAPSSLRAIAKSDRLSLALLSVSRGEISIVTVNYKESVNSLNIVRGLGSPEGHVGYDQSLPTPQTAIVFSGSGDSELGFNRFVVDSHSVEIK